MFVLFFSGFFNDNQKTILAIVLTIVYLLYSLISYLLNYSYFSFRINEDQLLFRFASIRPFGNNKNAINIKIEDFVGVEIEKSLLGYRKELTLKVKTKKGIANYPPISLSALSEKQIEMLKRTLNQFV